MLVVAAVEAMDTGPELLRISHSVPRLDAVAVHRFDAGGRRVELRILAASHQVVVRGGDGRIEHAEHPDHEGEHVETVACGLPESAGRPLRDGAVYDHRRWRVTADVVHLPAEPFRRQAATWRRRGEADAHTVVVRFPTHPDALTGLAWEGDGWTGAHLYPDPASGGVVVRTTTTACPKVTEPLAPAPATATGMAAATSAEALAAPTAAASGMAAATSVVPAGRQR